MIYVPPWKIEYVKLLGEFDPASWPLPCGVLQDSVMFTVSLGKIV